MTCSSFSASEVITINYLFKMLKYLILSVAIYCTYYTSDTLAQDGNGVVTQACLRCICEATSQCDTNKKCTGDICGPFGIMWSYWADSGKPTINQQSPDGATAYSDCTNDLYCASVSVQQYLEKFKQDCNGDGRIDCDDFVAIHKLGPYGCNGALPDWYKNRYLQCKQNAANQG